MLDGLGRLAVLSLIDTFTMAGVLLALGNGPEIPAWAAAVVSIFLGFFSDSGAPPADGAWLLPARGGLFRRPGERARERSGPRPVPVPPYRRTRGRFTCSRDARGRFVKVA